MLMILCAFTILPNSAEANGQSDSQRIGTVTALHGATVLYDYGYRRHHRFWRRHGRGYYRLYRHRNYRYRYHRYN